MNLGWTNVNNAATLQRRRILRCRRPRKLKRPILPYTSLSPAIGRVRAKDLDRLEMMILAPQPLTHADVSANCNDRGHTALVSNKPCCSVQLFNRLDMMILAPQPLAHADVNANCTDNMHTALVSNKPCCSVQLFKQLKYTYSTTT